jgi:hypothetical protein
MVNLPRSTKEVVVRLKYRVLYGIAVFSLATALGGAVVARASQAGQPSDTQVAFAQQVSDLLVNELVAALFQEFNETTPQNVEHGKQAISLIFNDLNRDIRLVGTFDPLGGDNSRPDGNFERRALQLALGGQPYTAVQKVNNSWYYRRSVPLSNSFHTACVLCHTNFTSDFFAQTNNPGQWVGALVLRVPIVAAQ